MTNETNIKTEYTNDKFNVTFKCNKCDWKDVHSTTKENEAKELAWFTKRHKDCKPEAATSASLTNNELRRMLFDADNQEMNFIEWSESQKREVWEFACLFHFEGFDHVTVEEVRTAIFCLNDQDAIADAHQICNELKSIKADKQPHSNDDYADLYGSEVMNELEKQPQDVKTAVKTYVEKVQACFDGANLTIKKEIKVVNNRKYFKIVENEPALNRKDDKGKMIYADSVFAFIDKDGNIYKPAGWKAPAKGIRGNVLSDQNGMESVAGKNSIPHIFYAR